MRDLTLRREFAPPLAGCRGRRRAACWRGLLRLVIALAWAPTAQASPPPRAAATAKASAKPSAKPSAAAGPTGAAPEQDGTERVRSDIAPSMLRKLRGRHRLYLQWIEPHRAGRITFSPRKGARWQVRGEQRGHGGEDWVRIDAELWSASASEIVLYGSLTSRIHHLAGGKECQRRGSDGGDRVRMTFARTKGRRYFRMQEMANPCDPPVVDYVDIHL